MFSMKKHGLALVALGLAGTLALAGCSSSSTPGSSSSAGGSGSSAAPGGLSISDMKADLAKYTDLVDPVPTIAPISGTDALKGKSVWWVPFGPSVDDADGTVREGLTKLGIDVHTCDGKFLPTTVASCLEQAANQNADAVVTGYIDYKVVPTAFDALVAKGIPVLLGGSINSTGKKQSAKFAFADTGVNQNQIAQLQLEKAIVDSNGKAHILWVGFTDGGFLVAASAFAESFVKANCPDCTFDQISTNSASVNKLASQVGAALNSHPATDYVLPEIDPGTPPTLQALKTAGLSSVKVIGSGAQPDSLSTLQSGGSQLIADTGVSSAYEGWVLANSLVTMMTGGVPSTSAKSIFRVFTPDNVTGLTATGDGYRSVDWYANHEEVIASFAKAWGVN